MSLQLKPFEGSGDVVQKCFRIWSYTLRGHHDTPPPTLVLMVEGNGGVDFWQVDEGRGMGLHSLHYEVAGVVVLSRLLLSKGGSWRSLVNPTPPSAPAKSSVRSLPVG